MQEKSLFIASLICSLFGILLITVIASKMEVPLFKISELKKDMLDQDVKVTGKIISIRETDGLFILTLKDYSGSIPVVVFKQGQETFKKQSSVEVIGKVAEYKKAIQITAKEIKTV